MDECTSSEAQFTRRATLWLSQHWLAQSPRAATAALPLANYWLRRQGKMPALPHLPTTYVPHLPFLLNSLQPLLLWCLADTEKYGYIYRYMMSVLRDYQISIIRFSIKLLTVLNSYGRVQQMAGALAARQSLSAAGHGGIYAIRPFICALVYLDLFLWFTIVTVLSFYQKLCHDHTHDRTTAAHYYEYLWSATKVNLYLTLSP